MMPTTSLITSDQIQTFTTKEIDDLRREVRTIKKHLGLSTEIAA
jgi:hypothetical protein